MMWMRDPDKKAPKVEIMQVSFVYQSRRDTNATLSRTALW